MSEDLEVVEAKMATIVARIGPGKVRIVDAAGRAPEADPTPKAETFEDYIKKDA